MGSTGRWVRGGVASILLASATVVVGTVADPSPPVAQAATPISLPVVARYEMNESAGATTMNDSGPNNLDGSIGSLITTGASYDGATGYRFTPQSPTNPATTPADPQRLVTIPDDPRLDPGTGDYAIEFRYRTNKSWGNVLQKGQNTTTGGYWKFEQPDGRMTCLFKDANGRTLGVKAPADRATKDNQWHTIRCERRANFGLILFIDGVEAAKNGNDPIAPLGSVSNTKQISIGGKSSCDQITATCDYFNGDIDYVQIEKGGAIGPPPNQPPDVVFDVECTGFACTFDGSDSTDPDGQIVRWDWAWGDGSPNTDNGDPTETHTFTGPGTYRVTLTGTDDDGARDTATRDVVLSAPNQPPRMEFVVECEALRCRFDAGGSTDADGTIEAYSWALGDGATRLNDDDPIHNHTYGAPGLYTVTLTGEDDDGATATATQDVPAAVQAPTASFTVTCTELRCDVDASASSDPDGTITDHAWTFGDGSTAAGVTTGHTYATPGSYTIELTVEDDDGVTATTSRTVTVDKQVSLPPSVAGATRLVPLAPERVFDTRESEPGSAPKGLVAGGTTITVDVEGLASVPDDGVAAVAINITAIAEEPGFVTVWQGGVDRPTASSINLTAAGQVRANLVVVPVGADGTISLFSLGDAHLLGDIAGYFADQTIATRAGRIVTQRPQRLFDTRPGEPGNTPKGEVPSGGTIEVQVLGQGGVPAAGVSAVVLTVTATGSTGPGFVTAWSGEGAAPTASVINLNNADETVPNQVIVPVSSTGTISFFSSTATHLLADVSGYVTDDAAAPSLTGLFVPLTPDRLFDTRLGEPGNGPKSEMPAAGTITPQIAEVAGVPAGAGAVLLNLTMIGTAPSFATAWPAGTDRPLASIVNVGGADVRANGATVALGDGGDISFFASAPAHLLADVSGYLVG